MKPELRAEVRDAENKASDKKTNENQQQNNEEEITKTTPGNNGATALDQPASNSAEGRKSTDINNTTYNKKPGRRFANGKSAIQKSNDPSTANNNNYRSRKPIKNKTQNLPAENDQQSAVAATFAELMKGKMPEIDHTKQYEPGEVKKDIPAPPAEAAKKTGG